MSATSVSLLCGYYSTTSTTTTFFGLNTYNGTCASTASATHLSTGASPNYGSIQYPVQLCVGSDGVNIYMADQGRGATSARDIRTIEIAAAPPPPSPPPR